jgi:hypothetical protein
VLQQPRIRGAAGAPACSLMVRKKSTEPGVHSRPSSAMRGCSRMSPCAAHMLHSERDTQVADRSVKRQLDMLTHLPSTAAILSSWPCLRHVTVSLDAGPIAARLHGLQGSPWECTI